MLFHKIISTGLGIGYIGKGAGTVAAAVTCTIWWFLQTEYTNPYLWPFLSTIVILLLGVISGDEVELVWGKDHQRVVIDEVAGMGIALLLVPLKWEFYLIAFILFRFFDIAKPLYIRRFEALPGGWGVMADDVLAGIYANFSIQAIVLLRLF
ncbi:phosphatidylglycerophosphatase A family protein [Pedobacter chinensis]|uniref:phosphatidylglycerophosphatase A family protein n=1 Tax=Pedobacter chinensis TaxID=2282421 RepID=UPI001F3C6F60|nr:phosphatidylglycerophosphatase A [Pedobacter chinensis]